MAKITFTQPDGSQQVVVAEPGMTVMEAARKELVPGIEAECGGACSCATCHVYVDDAWREKVGIPWRWKRTCSISPSTCGLEPALLPDQVTEALDGLVVRVPESSSSVPTVRSGSPSGPRDAGEVSSAEDGPIRPDTVRCGGLAPEILPPGPAVAGGRRRPWGLSRRRGAAALASHRSRRRGLPRRWSGARPSARASVPSDACNDCRRSLAQRARRHRQPEEGVCRRVRRRRAGCATSHHVHRSRCLGRPADVRRHRLSRLLGPALVSARHRQEATGWAGGGQTPRSTVTIGSVDRQGV